MMKLTKRLLWVPAFALILHACADSASINQYSASSYRQTINEARSKVC